MESSGLDLSRATLLTPSDPARVERTLEALAAKGTVIAAEHRPSLGGVFGNSPYLARLALREPSPLGQILAEGPQAVATQIGGRALAVGSVDDPALAMSALRCAKRGPARAIAP